jgi:uncharacterized membrane protein (DUF485 family)
MSTLDHVASHPIFRQLALERSRLGTALASILAVTYFTYILTIAFNPSALGVALHDGTVITWGLVLGVGLLIFGFVLTAIYVVFANSRLDDLSRRLQEDLQ